MSKFGKGLLAFSAMALAITAFASAAQAGVVRDVTTNKEVEKGHVFHFVGWASFLDEKEGKQGIECHVTAEVEADSGSTLTVKSFVPDTAHCVGKGATFSTCKVSKDENTKLPWHVTVLAEDFHIHGPIEIHDEFEAGSCPNVILLGRVTSVTLTFETVTAQPLITGTETNTNTSNTLGATAKQGEPIAGIELSGKGEAHIHFSGGANVNEKVEAHGKLELTSPDRCTWKISAT